MKVGSSAHAAVGLGTSVPRCLARPIKASTAHGHIKPAIGKPAIGAYPRGRLYLAHHDGAHAAAEFRKIVDHPDTEPTSPLFPLARLGLARALRLGGDRAGAHREYAALLAFWAHADPGIPALMAARAELAGL